MARCPDRMFNLGASGDPKSFVVDSLALAGQNGSPYEDNSMNAFQCFQLVDAGAVANDVVYVKAYNGSFLATPTVGNSSRNEVAGVVCTTVLVNQFTLLQQRGVRLVKYTGTAALTAARGSRVLPDSVGANSTDVANAGTAIVLAGNQNVNSIGVAQAAASGGNISTYLRIETY